MTEASRKIGEISHEIYKITAAGESRWQLMNRTQQLKGCHYERNQASRVKMSHYPRPN